MSNPLLTLCAVSQHKAGKPPTFCVKPGRCGAAHLAMSAFFSAVPADAMLQTRHRWSRGRDKEAALQLPASEYHRDRATGRGDKACSVPESQIRPAGGRGSNPATPARTAPPSPPPLRSPVYSRSDPCMQETPVACRSENNGRAGNENKTYFRPLQDPGTLGGQGGRAFLCSER